jgi:NADH dehydrogenase (ubiquinone) 1 beta subcomplex subunit 7
MLEALCDRIFANTTQDERHSYEKCQYEEFKLRVKKMDELKAQNPGSRSN